MNDTDKTKEQLLQELIETRHQLAQSQAAMAQSQYQQAKNNDKTHYQLLFDMAGDFVFIHRPGTEMQPGRFIDVSNFTCQALGYTYQEIMQIPPDKIMFNDDEKEAPLLKSSEDTKNLITHKYITTRHGDKVPVEVRSKIFFLDGEPAILDVGRDITSYRHYRMLFENIPLGISLTERDGQIFMINDTLKRILGYSIQELQQRDLILNYCNPEDRQKNFDQLEVEGIVRNFETELYRKDGTRFSARLSITPFTLVGENALLTIMEDITERKQVEEHRLALMLERERTQILTNFITQASHEFRTPLSIINTSIYLLDNLPHDNTARKKHRQKIEAQVHSLTALVNALTMMAMLDGLQRLPTKEIDLRKMLWHFHTETRATPVPDYLYFDYELGTQALVIRADEGHLQQAIELIIDNAIKFTPAGGTITLSAKKSEHQAVIKITDTGVGIHKQDLPHIFERFYRADVSGTTRGFGLGLPIAKRIVDLHQGSIEVDSHLREGTTVTILLPMVEQR